MPVPWLAWGTWARSTPSMSVFTLWVLPSMIQCCGGGGTGPAGGGKAILRRTPPCGYARLQAQDPGGARARLSGVTSCRDPGRRRPWPPDGAADADHAAKVEDRMRMPA